MEQNPLIGAWRLVTYEAHTGDDVLYPLGEDASGYIMYTPDGYMSVLMMAAGRPNFEAGDMLAGTDEEKLAAASTFVAYCGRYDYQEDRVIHKIEVAFYPNRVGTEQVRFIQLEGDELILTTPPMVLAGKSRKGRIVWQRAATGGE
ncbi:MAG: lipocalin-like domain-containing protein [Chloroflexota bacterium]|nr:lipocalin-like domain-containing protein [Chloroflexota bacterium]